MKYRLLTLLAASTLLFACGESSSSSAVSSGEASSQEAETSQGATSQGATSAETTQAASGWTAAEAEIVKGVLGVEVPNFGMTNYDFEGSVEEGYFEAIGTAVKTDINEYASALEALDFDVSVDVEWGELEGYIYEDDYSYAYVYISLAEEEDGSVSLDLYGSYFASVASWPEEDIKAYAEYTGLTDGIPAFTGAEAYVHYLGSYYGLFYYSVIECYGKDVSASSVDAYADVLTKAGYVYNSEYSSYDKGSITVSVEYTGTYLMITAYDMGEEEETTSEYSSYVKPETSIPWDEPTAGSGVFTFADESMLTTKGDKKSVWTSGKVTFTVEQGTSTVTVGNTSYYSDPLRLYTNQVITIDSEEAFTSVTFYVIEQGKATLDNLLGCVAPSGGTLSEGTLESTAVLSFSSGVTSASITLTEGQVRLYYVVVA